MDYSRYETLIIAVQDRVATVTLSRPDELNAVNALLHKELATIFDDLRRDSGVDIVVLTGAGRAFCAGGDLDWMQLSIDDPNEFDQVAREAKDIVRTQLALDKPLICRLNGHAAGLGASLALLCDIVIAQEGARISDPHVSVGLVAGDGGALIWPQLIGYAKARRYLFTGEAMTAGEAERLGLISEVVSLDELDASVAALVATLQKQPRKALKWTKVTANLALQAIFTAHFDTGIAYETVSNMSRDHQEAVTAFRERRKPVFTGD